MFKLEEYKVLDDGTVLFVEDEGDVVLDPFFGSGSTLVACVQSNRKYLGYELDPSYFDIACEWLDGVEAERERERERERNNNHNSLEGEK